MSCLSCLACSLLPRVARRQAISPVRPTTPECYRIVHGDLRYPPSVCMQATSAGTFSEKNTRNAEPMDSMDLTSTGSTKAWSRWYWNNMGEPPPGRRPCSRDSCTTALRPLSDRAQLHTQLQNAKPAQSCGILLRAARQSLAECQQLPQWPGHQTVQLRSDWTQMTHPRRPGLPGPNTQSSEDTPGPGPSWPGRPPQRSFSLGPGPSMSRCPPQGRHRHDGRPGRLVAVVEGWMQ